MPRGVYIRTREYRQKQRLAHIGRNLDQKTKDKISLSMKRRGKNSGAFKLKHRLNVGPRHPQWKGGKSQSFIYREMRKLRKKVISEHPFCSLCGIKEGLFL